MRMYHIDGNSWILSPPPPEERNPIMQVRVMALESTFETEPPPVFNLLSRHFWFNQFVDRPYSELLEATRRLGINRRRLSKGQLVDMLVRYFQTETGYLK